MSRILIVEDQRDVRRMLRAGIETLDPDIRIVDVPSGEEAMLLIAVQPFDLVIIDVRLPGISGLELKKRAQYQNPGLKLILITGVTDPDVRQEVAKAGADAYFFKPLEMNVFLDAVEGFLDLGEKVQTPHVDEGEGETAEVNLSERLSGLRHALNAVSVLLLDDRGIVMAGAGDIPDPNIESHLVPALMSAFSAACKVSRFLGKDLPENLLFFAGERYDLHLAQVGHNVALLVVTPAATGTDKSFDTQVRNGILGAIDDLVNILGKIGVPGLTGESDLDQAALPGTDASFFPGAEPVPENASAQEEPDPQIEEIFSQAPEAGMKPAEVEAFWDSLAEVDVQPGVISADAITYDQARSLGLTPEEED
jgi:DNA-binding NarL/FixJ family response regulator